jgi:hypothetical protein
MENVRLIYEQIEEARKYLSSGSLLQLRLALILLDNAIELMMWRELENEFARYDHWEPKWEPARTEWIQAGLGPKYTPEERKDAEREFEPKARILGFRLGRISQNERTIITVCHKLRCGAFHKGHLRREILSPVCTLLYLTCAALTTTLGAQGFVIHPLSEEDRTFLARFGISDPSLLATDQGTNQLHRKLIEGVSMDTAELADTLSADLVARLDSIVDGLAYVGGTDDESKIDYNLQHTEFWRERGAELAKQGLRGQSLDRAFEEWKLAGRAEYTLSKLKKWREHSVHVARSRNPAGALACYWALESKFRTLEAGVQEAVARFDVENG